jgi:hypothetical protein
MPLAVVGVLSSCGGGGGSSATTNTSSGLSSDGYLSGSTVFLDTNANGSFDSGEPSTTTNADGSYSLSYDNALSGNLVVFGGTDIATGKAFTGKLEALATNGTSNINPISNLVAKKVKHEGIDPTNAKAAVAKSIGLADASKIDEDPISLQKDSGDNSMIQVALAVQKTIEDMSAAALADDSSLSTIDVMDDIFTSFALEADVSVADFDTLLDKAVASTKTITVDGAEVAIGNKLPIAAKKVKENAKQRFKAVQDLVGQIGSSEATTATTAISTVQKLIEEDIAFMKKKYEKIESFATADAADFAIEIKIATNTAVTDLVDEDFYEEKVLDLAIESRIGTSTGVGSLTSVIRNLDGFDIDKLQDDEFLDDLAKLGTGELGDGAHSATFAILAQELQKEKNAAEQLAKEQERAAKSGSVTLPEAVTLWGWLEVYKDNTGKTIAELEKVRLNGSSIVEYDFEYSKGLAGGWTQTADVAGSPTYTWTKTGTWEDEESVNYQLVNNTYAFDNYQTVSLDYADDISGKSLRYNGTYIAQMPQSYKSVTDENGNVIQGSIEYGLNINKDNVMYVGNVFAEANPYTSLSSFVDKRCAHLDKPLRKYDSDGNGSYDVAITMVSVGTKTTNSKTICDYDSTETGTIALYEWDESSGKFTNTALVADFGTWERKTIHNKEVIVATPHQSVSGDCDDECGSKQPLWTMKKFPSSDTAVVWSGNLVNKEFKSYAYNPVAAKAIRGKTKARLNGIVAKSSEQGFVFTKEMLAGNTFYTVDPKGDMYIDAFNSDASKIITTESDGSTFSATVNTIDNSIDITDDNGTKTKLIPISKAPDAGDYYRVAFEDLSNGSISEGRMFASQTVAQAYQNAKNNKVKPITGETAFKFDEGDLDFGADKITATFYILTKTCKDCNDESISWGWEHGKMEFKTSNFAYTSFNSGFIGDSTSNNSGTFTISDGVINFSMNSETIKFIPVGSSTRNNITYYRYIDDDQSSQDPSIHPGYMFLTREDMLNFKP